MMEWGLVSFSHTLTGIPSNILGDIRQLRYISMKKATRFSQVALKYQ